MIFSNLLVATLNVSTYICAILMKIEEAIKQSHFKSEYQKMVVNVIYTSNWLLSQNAKALKPLALTTQQFNILRILKGQFPNPAPVSLLTERMLDKMSNASRLVDKLEEKNLVIRTICKKDRRQVDVVLTKQGISLLEEANLAVQSATAFVKELSEEESKTLNELLDKLRSNGSKFE
jgi:DNA-binding MarR family transcriptional regulator